MMSPRAGLERMTLNLTERSSHALGQMCELTNLSRTDLVNRAIQLYGYLLEVTETGGDIYVRRGPDCEIELLKFF